MRVPRLTGAALALACVAAALGHAVTTAPTADAAATTAAPPATTARTGLRAADPSVIRVGGTYVSVQSIDDHSLHVRQASTPDGLAAAPARQVWSDTRGLGEVWAPEIVRDGGRYWIYFAAGRGAAHRMYAISSASPDTGYTAETRLALPDDKWAIDGVPFVFNGQRWFVWSGWAGDTDVEQNLYVARMSGPTTVTGARHVISQPREPWERVVGNPYINEAPEPIRDPDGRLHVVYSANGSWSDQYCVADLRLRAGGDPAHVWDWYKSNGCLFGSHAATMMPGWTPTVHADGPGHHTFVLLDGDIATSPPAGPRFPLLYHAVPKGMPYSWANRHWHTGTFCWWGATTYRRANVPGATSDTGFGLKFFE
ncbi:glycoside hydrolase family 43 protein [Spirilliplanes yamanashiensis]|uniref:Hydrolase n=1 Tax=Spirilliplanes yamanashiensis TaxID=42233 RepID=A0A8J3YAF4_9ACTN|nr:glycoside hydrolase family 43 protein [Spirilliplanes yamanashiensis]MDP9817590.1 GH43 family beta-xylosidase [Spirilliplanes yamanashiensis]GIJ04400.1 hydrolase [Spirilliplanes yamanashiensis]